MKKMKIPVLCFLLAVVLRGAVNAADTSFTVQSFLVKESEITVSVDLTGNTQTLNFYAAFYAENGKYLKSETKRQSVYSFTSSVSIPINNGIPDNADTVRLIVLDDDSRPVCPAVSKSAKASVFAYEITDTDFHYWPLLGGSYYYRAFVEITNTGTQNLYMKECTFDFEDNNGHLLKSDTFISSCPDIIAPGEKGYFYNGSSPDFSDVSMGNGVKFVPDVTVIPATGEPLDYEVFDTALKAGTFGMPTLTGRVKNTTDKDTSLYIEVIYYDATGKVLTISGTNVYDFTARSTKSFEINGLLIGENATMETIADYKVLARAYYYQFG